MWTFLKDAVRKDLRASDCPMTLWDYAIEHRVIIHNVIPGDPFQNNGLTPYATTFGESGDISNICSFESYQWIYYRDNGSFPSNKDKLGRVLGPVKNEGNEMAQAVLTVKATVVPRRTMRKLTKVELLSDIEKRKRSSFDSIIKSKLGDSITLPPQPQPIEQDLNIDIDDPYFDSLPKDTDPVDPDNVATLHAHACVLHAW